VTNSITDSAFSIRIGINIAKIIRIAHNKDIHVKKIAGALLILNLFIIVLTKESNRYAMTNDVITGFKAENTKLILLGLNMNISIKNTIIITGIAIFKLYTNLFVTV